MNDAEQTLYEEATKPVSDLERLAVELRELRRYTEWTQIRPEKLELLEAAVSGIDTVVEQLMSLGDV